MPKRSPPKDMVLSCKKKKRYTENRVWRTRFRYHCTAKIITNTKRLTIFVNISLVILLKIIFDQNGWTLPNPPTSATFNMLFVRSSVVFLFPETSFFSVPRPLFSQYPPAFLSIVNSALAIFTTVCLCGSGFVVRPLCTVVSLENTANYGFLPNPVRFRTFSIDFRIAANVAKIKSTHGNDKKKEKYFIQCEYSQKITVNSFRDWL